MESTSESVVVNQYSRSAGVPPVTPAAPSRPRTWLRRIMGGGQIIETCPKWCQSSHANDDAGCLDDLTHGTDYVATTLTMHAAGSDGPATWPVLAARISVDPYSEDPARNIPHVTFEPSQDDVMECLDPDAFAAVIAQVRAHLGELEQVHAQLVAARAEYGAR